MGEDALVVVYSDHGEEFFEHGQMGHGHNLSEELLMVPLIIRDPSLPAGRVSAPVSLIDIAPTILDLLSLPLPEGEVAMDGVSLVQAAHGDPPALSALQHRPQAYGRILFGDDSWGVLLEGKKWVSSGLEELLFDLDRDPTEDHNLLEGQALDTQVYLDALAERLSRPVSRVWRADAAGEHVFIEPHTAQLWFSHPDEIGQTWTRWDPMSKRTSPFEEGRRVGLHRDDALRSPRELFIEPGSSPVGARLELRIGQRVYIDTLSAEEFRAWVPGEPLLQIGPENRPAHFGWTVQPTPMVNEEADLDSDVEAALEAMGYLD